MRKATLVAAVVLLAAGSATAFAQGAVVVTPDATTTGSTVVIPGEVRTYVMEQQAPASVVYDGDIAVGTTLPDTVEIHTIPDNDGYAYTVVNERRVIVEPRTHKVVQVLD